MKMFVFHPQLDVLNIFFPTWDFLLDITYHKLNVMSDWKDTWEESNKVEHVLNISIIQIELLQIKNSYLKK